MAAGLGLSKNLKLRKWLGAPLGRVSSGGPLAFAYYVSAAGSDSNPGTQSQPWQTVAKVAAQSFQPNTTVYFRGGDTFTGPLTLPAASGTSGLPIKYTSYGTGQATINSAANNHGITGTDLSYVTIDNLNVTGPGSASTSGHGIFLQWTATAVAPSVSITNNTVSGFAGTGIYGLCTTATAQTSGILVSGNTVTSCTYGDTTTSGTAAILIRGTTGFQTAAKNLLNPHVTLNTVKNNLGVTGSVNHCGSGILVLHADTGLMDYNYSDNNGQNCNNAAGPCGIWYGFSTKSIIRRNIVTNQKTASSDGHGYDLDGGCDNCLMEENFSSGNAGYGLMCYEYDNANFTTNNGNVVRKNISFNDISGGLRLVSGGTHANSGQCYNNRFVGRTTTVGGIIKLEDNGGGLTWTIANNSIETQNTGTTDLILTSAGHAPNCSFYGNNYLTAGTFRITWNGTTYASMALWRAGVVGQETIGGSDTSKNVTGTYVSPSGSPYIRGPINVEPARPLETSPLMNAGVDLFANFSINPGSTDLFGSPLSTSGPWSIGPAAMKSAVKSVILSTTGDGTWTVPADFAALFAVDCIGAGGSNSSNAAGAGGGAFARSYMQTAAASWVAGTTTVPFHVGAAVSGSNGENATFGATTLAAAIALGKGSACGAEGGKANVGSTGGIGGLAVNSVGDICYDGGSGGNGTAFSQSGGGGAGSLAGSGLAGGGGAAATARGAGGGGGAGGGLVGSVSASTVGGAGGQGPLGNGGGAGGNTGAGSAGAGGSGGGGSGNAGGAGGAGGNGLDWSTNGSGGGAGAALGATSAITGGLFGGGAGGRGGGNGGQSGIRILYKTPASL